MADWYHFFNLQVGHSIHLENRQRLGTKASVSRSFCVTTPTSLFLVQNGRWRILVSRIMWKASMNECRHDRNICGHAILTALHPPALQLRITTAVRAALARSIQTMQQSAARTV